VFLPLLANKMSKHTSAKLRSPWYDLSDREDCPAFSLRKSGIPKAYLELCSLIFFSDEANFLVMEWIIRITHIPDLHRILTIRLHVILRTSSQTCDAALFSTNWLDLKFSKAASQGEWTQLYLAKWNDFTSPRHSFGDRTPYLPTTRCSSTTFQPTGKILPAWHQP
jgi:hypothetical protein